MSLHRQAFLVWISVLPTLTVVQVLFGDVLAKLPALVRPPIVATIVVPVVVYVLMPALATVLSKNKSLSGKEQS